MFNYNVKYLKKWLKRLKTMQTDAKNTMLTKSLLKIAKFVDGDERNNDKRRLCEAV
jgi:hypothetical protein